MLTFATVQTFSASALALIPSTPPARSIVTCSGGVIPISSPLLTRHASPIPLATHFFKFLELDRFGNLENKMSYVRGNHHSQSPTRYHRRDLRLPCHRSRHPSTIVHSHIQIMGSILPASSLPHYPLHFSIGGQMGRDVSCAGREPRPSCQTSTLLDPKA